MWKGIKKKTSSNNSNHNFNDDDNGGRMRELSIKEFGCNSYSLMEVGKYYVNLDIK